ncbi:MAG: hypothetical protein P9L92_09290 [Candidatus Electryonea clarkiae]|nr:hypothetical protein [Candidatus Electryonea clarkiae]MDP8286632.1 hypothetical protein [Candidatus Electryonea clarkiae]
MKKATTLHDLLKVLKPFPLTGNDFDNFWVETDQARGYNAAFYLSDFFCTNIEAPQKVLFMGHRGSGKSTELYRVGKDIQDKFRVINFSVRKEMDITNLKYIDLLFVILDKLYEVATEEDGIKINKNIIANLDSYWNDEKIKEILAFDKASFDAGVEAKAGIWNFLRAHIRGGFSLGTETRELLRKRIAPKLSRLINDTNDVISNIRGEYQKKGKVPLLIIEDLDKLDIDVAEELFLKHRDVLTRLDIHIIYTFPIFLHYTENFNAIREAFDHAEMLSMIKVRNVDGSMNNEGFDVIKRIMNERAEDELFEPGIIDYVIEKSGGVLRHVFEMLQNAVLEVRSRDIKADKIDKPSVEMAFNKLQGTFERSIARRHVIPLVELYNSEDKKALADERLKEMFNCMAVIEYNGVRWCNLHPAVVKLLREIGEIPDDGESGSDS